MTADDHPCVLRLHDVSVVRQGRALVAHVDLDIRAGEQWALLGPNGAGKSTLLALCGAQLHPTTGTVHVLGHRLGRVDMRELRTHIGHVDPRTRIDPYSTVREAVLTGLYAATALPRRAAPSTLEQQKAEDLITVLGLGAITDSPWSVLSQGERGRALIARALVTDPDLLLLDEPTTGLDLAAREILLSVLAELRQLRPELSSILVTHHLEELPTSTSHALVLAHGTVVGRGRVEDTLTSETITRAFGHPIVLERRAGRWTATGAVDAHSN
ncbi:iron complex transport system ATP-binding protein [Rhodococcus rhodochrous J3]|uniref:Iron complex transport system ATP-binding protein n=1 Tax=Rhodococcus rhodochrous J3 TaxID=903528 RepID=A0ABY1M5P3_RHORH|nr:ATP-binding cassette domain-containing protein [Rhodococcus rhodochrous]TWH60965.1 iron complex transport system ATP-binding protein [Rhodococcus rhodochrous J38]SMG13631.1 iron complex transport system ATP-binding protein [Rhodococcus rhodochrous J3]